MKLVYDKAKDTESPETCAFGVCLPRKRPCFICWLSNIPAERFNGLDFKSGHAFDVLFAGYECDIKEINEGERERKKSKIVPSVVEMD